MTSFLSNLFDSMDKATEPKQTPKDKLLDFEKMIRDDANKNGIQPRTHLANLCAQNETFAQSKVVQMMLGEYKARQLNDPKTEVLVVKDGKVITIDKKDLAKYKAQGYGLAEAHGGKHTTTGRSMTKGEEGEKERLVKGMKKNKSDFKKRYGKDADAVMYATATKKAMAEGTMIGGIVSSEGQDLSEFQQAYKLYKQFMSQPRPANDSTISMIERFLSNDEVADEISELQMDPDSSNYVSASADDVRTIVQAKVVDDLNLFSVEEYPQLAKWGYKNRPGEDNYEHNDLIEPTMATMEGALNLDRDTMSDSIGDMVETYVKRAPIEEINKILQFIKANKTVSQSKDSDRVIMTTEDGHTDTDSMQAKTAQIAKDAMELYKLFQNNPGDENIMTWITNKLAVAADKISSVKDYLQNPTQDGVSEAPTGIAYGAAGILAKHPEAYADLKQGGDIMDHDELYQELFAYYSDTDDMPYGVQKARDGDPYEWIMNALDDADLLEGNSNHVTEYKRVEIKDKEDYMAKKKELQRLQMDPATNSDEKLKKEIIKRKADLDDEAKKMGLKEDMNTMTRFKEEVADLIDLIQDGQEDNPGVLADELTDIINGTYDPRGATSEEEINMRTQANGAVEMLEKGALNHAVIMLRKTIDDNMSEDFPEQEELTLKDDQDFHEAFGFLSYPTSEIWEAEYQGRKVQLNKPTRGDVKKFKVYVKDPKTGNVKKVNFGHGGTSAKRPTMRIRKSNPAARRSFRARHNCDNPGPKTKARYWSCRKW